MSHMFDSKVLDMPYFPYNIVADVYENNKERFPDNHLELKNKDGRSYFLTTDRWNKVTLT